MYKIKKATDIGNDTTRRVTARTDRPPRVWVFWVVNRFKIIKVIVIEY